MKEKIRYIIETSEELKNQASCNQWQIKEYISNVLNNVDKQLSITLDMLTTASKFLKKIKNCSNISEN